MNKYIVHHSTKHIECETLQIAEDTAIKLWISMCDDDKEKNSITIEQCLEDHSLITWNSQNILDSDIIPFKYQGNFFYLELDHSSLDSVILNQLAKDKSFGIWERISYYDNLNSTTFYSNLRTTNINFLKIGQKIGKQVTNWTQVIGTQPQITEITQDMKVSTSGCSLIIRITDCCRMLNIEQGDIINVTLRKKTL